MKRTLFNLAGGLAVAATLSCAATIGQTDTFQTGLDNWFAGGLGFGQIPPVPPFVISSGGPAGAGDAFLTVVANTPSGPGSRVGVLNQSQWAGNYIAAGINAISLNLNNLGPTPLTIRLSFEDSMGGPPADEALTAFGAFLPVDSGWLSFTFPITSADLIALSGTTTNALADNTLLRIINAPQIGEAAQQVGILGIDNITARGNVNAVPEPSSFGMGLTLLGLLAVLRSRRHRTSTQQ